MLLLLGCCDSSEDMKFLTKHEYDHFTQFKGTYMFYRGQNKEQYSLVVLLAPSRQNHFDEICFFYIYFKDTNNFNFFCNNLGNNNVCCDTNYIIGLTSKFLSYKISELEVDTIGNVRIDWYDYPELELVRFVNEEEMLKRSKETKWIKVKDNWYKPKQGGSVSN
jgi:hypothetical protein